MKKMFESEIEKEKAVIVDVAFNKIRYNFETSTEELKSLCGTANLQVVGETTQNIKEENPATLLGSGKVDEIALLVKQTNANVVVVNCELTGSQNKNITDVVGVKVIDRSMLILDIFAMRAKTNEGRLQVKLAMLKYNLPRLAGISNSAGRFGSAGVGMRGPGETKLEMDKRSVRESIIRLEKEIDKLDKTRAIQRQNRVKNRIKNVAIVGYTNAGKSTLMNTISKANIYADNLLFATLDTTSRNVYLEPNKQIVLTDTVGFISNLPHAFIQAFNSTLEETKDADLLLHVNDVSNSNYKEQIEVVEDVLKQIHADKVPTIKVYNKIDCIKGPFEVPQDTILISAKKNTNIEILKSKIIAKLFKD